MNEYTNDSNLMRTTMTMTMEMIIRKDRTLKKMVYREISTKEPRRSSNKMASRKPKSRKSLRRNMMALCRSVTKKKVMLMR